MADLEDLLVKTSRTFALSIPLLPEPVRREVTIAYLLFRIADTFEDASHWSREARIEALRRFDDLLEGDAAADATADVEGWLAQGPSQHEGYVELISEVPAVLAAYFSLAPMARQAVCRHTVRTSRRMARFVARTGDDDALELDDVADLQRYCYAVAGIVGELLTDLFLLGEPHLEEVAPFLRQRAATFGEALQLVNILKDSDDDAQEGRRYLPAAVPRTEIFALARHDLEVAREYVHAMQAAGGHRGMVAFTALPVLLAWATLDRVEAAGPGAKIERSEVAQIVADMNLALDERRPPIPVDAASGVDAS